MVVAVSFTRAVNEIEKSKQLEIQFKVVDFLAVEEVNSILALVSVVGESNSSSTLRIVGVPSY